MDSFSGFLINISSAIANHPSLEAMLLFAIVGWAFTAWILRTRPSKR